MAKPRLANRLILGRVEASDRHLTTLLGLIDQLSAPRAAGQNSYTVQRRLGGPSLDQSPGHVLQLLARVESFPAGKIRLSPHDRKYL